MLMTILQDKRHYILLMTILQDKRHYILLMTILQDKRHYILLMTLFECKNVCNINRPILRFKTSSAQIGEFRSCKT